MRLGKRTEIIDHPIKCRPLRFSVRSFQVKRELLKASMALRETDDEMLSTCNTIMYFMPDLTKCLRAEAFKHREDIRYQMNELHESNLKISRGQIVKIPEKVETSACSWTTCEWYMM